jgi:(E)-4-hydroxy-3-methylbut-2-enyl-diphosphate synthase
MLNYCESTHRTMRWQTRAVMVGNVGVGGENPVRIQSMTNSSTRDVEATIAQIIRLADSGCEIARVTVQGMKEADACEGIKNGLLKKGYTIPLVADIHFYPPAAMRVVDFVDKVRINPGNFADKRASFKVIEYDDASYAEEIVKIEEKFVPLVLKCKTLKRAMRIGTNHGSLSDRIMNRYGDTPRGMVESALEYARICRAHDYHDLIFSMKSSNPQVMIQAYRMLVAQMRTLGWNYPLHLGVTEAGEGEDGRIKSAMGIGSLLLDGIGDTVRVSLTEDPWYEIDPCQRLVNFAASCQGKGIEPFSEPHRSIEQVNKRPIQYTQKVGLHRDGTVIVAASSQQLSQRDLFRQLGCEGAMGHPKLRVSTADLVSVDSMQSNIEALTRLKEIGVGMLSNQLDAGVTSLLSLPQATLRAKRDKFAISFTGSDGYAVRIGDETPEQWELLRELSPAFIVFNPTSHRLHSARRFFSWLHQNAISLPVILKFDYSCSKEDMIIQASAECGALLCDGLGEGLWLEGPYEIDFLRNLAFGILQAARMRTFKTDFISCPSCGRTLFDLQDVTKRIRARTAHLPGVKIAIMGCIVNGPGEMADADFGYVGSKPGKIDLYVGKECVEKDIDFADADDRLVGLIKAHGRWKEPEEAEMHTAEWR